MSITKFKKCNPFLNSGIFDFFKELLPVVDSGMGYAVTVGIFVDCYRELLPLFFLGVLGIFHPKL